jgi:hypothetical protein
MEEIDYFLQREKGKLTNISVGNGSQQKGSLVLEIACSAAYSSM